MKVQLAQHFQKQRKTGQRREWQKGKRFVLVTGRSTYIGIGTIARFQPRWTHCPGVFLISNKMSRFGIRLDRGVADAMKWDEKRVDVEGVQELVETCICASHVGPCAAPKACVVGVRPSASHTQPNTGKVSDHCSPPWRPHKKKISLDPAPTKIMLNSQAVHGFRSVLSLGNDDIFILTLGK